MRPFVILTYLLDLVVCALIISKSLAGLKGPQVKSSQVAFNYKVTSAQQYSKNGTIQFHQYNVHKSRPIYKTQ